MGKKFDAIFESVVQRYQAGGFLNGDTVKFKSGYKSNPTYKAMHPEMQAQVDDLVNSGINIKVTQVGEDKPKDAAGGQHVKADNAVITVAGDHGGGRFYGQVTVPASMLELVPLEPNQYAEIPDQFRRKSPGYDKGTEFKRDTKHLSNLTDKGNGKNTPTQLKLAGESAFKKDTEKLSFLYENLQNDSYIDDRERSKITQAITQVGLDGNGRFETVGKGISALAQALDSVGYSLDMVSDHEISSAHHRPGSKGRNLLPFRRKNVSDDPYSENPEIENSRISFNWEDLGRGTGFEIVAYAS